MYTDATENSASYNEDRRNITTWDAAWDVEGNVAVTYWDIDPTEYTESTSTTPTYTEQ